MIWYQSSQVLQLKPLTLSKEVLHRHWYNLIGSIHSMISTEVKMYHKNVIKEKNLFLWVKSVKRMRTWEWKEKSPGESCCRHTPPPCQRPKVRGLARPTEPLPASRCRSVALQTKQGLQRFLASMGLAAVARGVGFPFPIRRLNQCLVNHNHF